MLQVNYLSLPNTSCDQLDGTTSYINNTRSDLEAMRRVCEVRVRANDRKDLYTEINLCPSLYMGSDLR